MSLFGADPKLVELARDALLADIASGKLAVGALLSDDEVARRLGVSRQPAHEALLALRRVGVLREGPGGLHVAPLDIAQVRSVYEVREVIEGLAFRLAAQREPERARAEGPDVIRAGRQAVERGRMADMIEADMAFHEFIHGLAGNALLAATLEREWMTLQRVIGEVLMRGERPRDVWDQHEAMLDAVVAGDAEGAEQLARRHIAQAGAITLERLQRDKAAE